MSETVGFSGSIEYFAKQSGRAVLFITVLFSLGPAIWKLLLGRSPDRLSEGLSVLWIPFCFLTIPIIHHLCRELIALQKRVAHLEKDHLA